MYEIYITTNLVNGKKYIGQHLKSTTKKYDYYLGSGKLLKQAIQKYGKENFKKEILCLCETQEEANEKEKEYILRYNAVEDSNFYNIAFGGQDGEGFKYYQEFLKTHPEEREKHNQNRILGLQKYCKEHPEERRELGKENIKKCHQWMKQNKEKLIENGKINGTKNLKQWAKEHPKEFKKNQEKGIKALKQWAEEHPEETKRNLALGPQANKEKNGKKVICINTNQVFNSIREAEQFYGLSKDTVGRCIRGVTKSGGKDPQTKEKLYWKLLEEREFI